MIKWRDDVVFIHQAKKGIEEWGKDIF